MVDRRLGVALGRRQRVGYDLIGLGDQLAALNLRRQVVAQDGGRVESVGKFGPDELMFAAPAGPATASRRTPWRAARTASRAAEG